MDMNRRNFSVVVTAVALLTLLIGIGINDANGGAGHQDTNKSVKLKKVPVADPVCDGTTVTSNCVVDGVRYINYTYHPAVPEKSHVETVTDSRKQVVGYCTLCNDYTYSPSCATGRGACSYHGGVKEWNAPQYSSVPVTSSKTVVDAPAVAEYYDKVIAQ